MLEKFNSVKSQHILIKSSQPISPIRGILTLILGENCDKTATSEETKINALHNVLFLNVRIQHQTIFINFLTMAKYGRVIQEKSFG